MGKTVSKREYDNNVWRYHLTLIEKVARGLCAGAAHVEKPPCLFCEDEKDCTLWPTFQDEARLAIAAVRKSDRGK